VNFGLTDAAPRAHAFERFLSHLGLQPNGGGGGVRSAPLSEVPAASRWGALQVQFSSVDPWLEPAWFQPFKPIT
jgi:hypothetical protein